MERTSIFDSTRIVARIESRPDDQPMRLRTHGRRARSVGRYASVKSGRMLAWESRKELHDLMNVEVDSNVVSSRVQPHTLKFVMDDARQIYTPDRADTLADGSIEIIEVKGDFDENDDPEYTRKLAYARAFYEGLGWSFRLTDGREIEAQPRFAAVELIQAYRRTSITTADIMKLNQEFRSAATIALGDAQALLGGGALGFAKLSAMVVRRFVGIDLGRALSLDTAVSAIEAKTDA